MNAFDLLPLARALGWALLHSLWQGAVVGLLAAGCLHAARDWAPAIRYRLAATSLAIIILAFAGTFVWMLPHGNAALSAEGALLAPILGSNSFGGRWPQLWASIASWVPWLTLVWGLGLGLRLFKVAGGLVWLYGPCLDGAEPPPNDWQRRFDALHRTSGIRRMVRFASSRSVDSLLVLGWLRPVILVPTSAFLAMPPEALEALLIHELAHIRRGDYLANLVQTLAESLLFYHPAVWWLSGRIRQEREHCCDDAAVQACGDPILYASALLGLEELRTQPKLIPDLAVAASGGRLMSRIQRLLRPRPMSGAISPALFLLPACLLAAMLGTASLTARPADELKPTAAPKSETKAEEPVDMDFKQIVIKHQPEAPSYPPEAKEAGIQGTVVVLLTIDVEGLVSSAKAISGPEELHECAVDYAKAWIFEPAKLNGKSVPARFKLTMPFRLL
ncbi:M56 family metallopeptidase [Geothrix sp. PMB-07]|uniref:M56 family metallopeptidase n=1 Tax=Geothrix sp. PMB-07 TaxID=3068640 RepID=UPI002740C9AF|nr:M56 family metallopeptidase [Geothrix sp. PMB-07]WLT30166.1 M56 family metallopeptidase [Geothrix sp. PMB-07]